MLFLTLIVGTRILAHRDADMVTTEILKLLNHLASKNILERKCSSCDALQLEATSRRANPL